MFDEEPFSHRQGYVRHQPKEITIREQAPPEVVEAIINIANTVGNLDCDELLEVAAGMQLREQPWRPPTVMAGVSSKFNLKRWLTEWPWYRFYDFIEVLHGAILKRGWQDVARVRPPSRRMEAEMTHQLDPNRPELVFERAVNHYFEQSAVGWHLVGGRVEARGSEAFESGIRTAMDELDNADRRTASREIHEALQDLSRRPKPDLTGAVQHAAAALECVARDVCGDPKAVFGDIVKRHADLFPRPLDEAAKKIWGYASEKARHLREGSEPEREEAELVVGLAASLATYLSRRNPSNGRP